MKIAPRWIAVVGIVIFTLFAMSVFLLRQNISCLRKNRELLLQNDSIISANIRLTGETAKWKCASSGVPEKRNHAKDRRK
jgi:hypothetical protein